ncbi:hypothetical protein ACEPAI_4298 [Sanghuangporus weigelae]
MPDSADVLERASRDSTEDGSPSPTVAIQGVEGRLNPSKIDIPDGGFEAWSTLAGAFIVVFCTSGYVNSFGVYEDFYVRQYLTSFTTSQISWIGSAQTFCLFSVGILSGYAMDIGYFRHVMFAGSVLFVFCLFMISISHPERWYQLFLAQGIGLGFAIGSTYVPALGVVAHHFARRRSLVMGIVASASSVGGIVHPILLNQLIHGSAGFAWGVRASAFMNGVLLAIANLMMTTRLPNKSKQSFAELVLYWRGFFRDPSYNVACVGTFLLIAGVFYPTFYLQLMAVERGVSTTLAFYTIAILNGASAFGRVMPVVVVDRVGVFALIVPCTMACGILIFCLAPAVTGAAGAVIMAILCGFFSGACISLLGPMLANLSRNVSEVGARIGVCFGIGGVGSLIGPPITGALLGVSNDWIRPAAFCGSSMCASALILAGAGWLNMQRKSVNPIARPEVVVDEK